MKEKRYTCSEQPKRIFIIVDSIGSGPCTQVRLQDIKDQTSYGFVDPKTLKEIK